MGSNVKKTFSINLIDSNSDEDNKQVFELKIAKSTDTTDITVSINMSDGTTLTAILSEAEKEMLEQFLDEDITIRSHTLERV